MKLSCKLRSIWVVALAAGLCNLPASQGVPSTAATSPSSHSSHHQPTHGSAIAVHHKHTHGTGAAHTKTASHHKQASKQSQTTAAKTGHGSSAHHKTAAQRSTAYTRLAHMQMDPARVEDIQQALIKAGDLQGAPSGRWDVQTREAMAHYQTDNGFGVTGLPDAKSLMKLGLGPHALPPQLDKTRAPASFPGTEDGTSSMPNAAQDTSVSPARTADPTVAVPPAGADPPIKH